MMKVLATCVPGKWSICINIVYSFCLRGYSFSEMPYERATMWGEAINMCSQMAEVERQKAPLKRLRIHHSFPGGPCYHLSDHTISRGAKYRVKVRMEIFHDILILQAVSISKSSFNKVFGCGIPAIQYFNIYKMFLGAYSWKSCWLFSL